MSQQAPFVDAATSIDPTNEDNTFISYYTWGSVLGLALDLSLRKEFGKPLDGYMRMMWTKYGQSEVPYTLQDLQTTLVEYSGNKEFADSFFARYIVGREVPDMAALLAQAGLLLRPRNPDGAWLGPVRLAIDSAGGRVDGPTLIGSPLYAAGLDRGDVMLTPRRLSRSRPDSVRQAVKAAAKPGDVIAVDLPGPRTEEHGARDVARRTPGLVGGHGRRGGPNRRPMRMNSFRQSCSLARAVSAALP